MSLVKVTLIGLVSVTILMADIRGIVTDTGTTPLSGAVVQLEKGGQADTTDVNGRFSLAMNTAILPGTRSLLANNLSARIIGNMMTVSIMDRATVEVTTFDLTGKALSTIRKNYNAGSHSISLPYRSNGVYLYKVKSQKSELVLKSNTIYGTPCGFSGPTKGQAPDHLAKKAQITATINDVIAVTKAGYLNYHCVQYNADTSEIRIKMISNAGDLTDIDGNVYQTVRIGNQIWMGENLRVTKYNDGTPIPFDTSTATWADATTPFFCYYDNTINDKRIRRYGALYNWYVVSPMNLMKIAPAGWHVPSDAEWDTLQRNLVTMGYNYDGVTSGNKIAKSLSAMTDWPSSPYEGTIGYNLTLNNRSGFSALPAGYRYDFAKRTFLSQGDDGGWWSSTKTTINPYAMKRELSKYNTGFGRGSKEMFCGFSVRLLKD